MGYAGSGYTMRYVAGFLMWKLNWLNLHLSGVSFFYLHVHGVVRCERFTLSVDGWEVEPTLGSVMLLTRFRMFWIFWSEILMCISGSSPETLNLKHRGMCLQLEGGTLTCGYGALPGHPGILLYHTFAKLYGEVHWMEDVLDRWLL